MTSDWRSISERMASESPVFIAGIPRSGTSVLRFTLGRLSSFAGKEEKSAETFVFARPDSVANLFEPQGRRLLRYFFGDRTEAEALAASLSRLGFDPRALGERDRTLGFEARIARWKEAKADHALRLFFHHAQRARGVRRTLEKTPAHVHYVPEILATFPNAKFVFCLRHPVDTFASFKKRLDTETGKGRGDRRLEWLRVSVGRFCGDFAKVVRDIDEALARDPACGIILDYAELTTAPRAALGRVCAFVAEPYDETVLFSAPGEMRASDGTPQPEGRVVANPGEWSKYVSIEEAREIESRLAALLARFGYPRRSAPPPSP